MKDNGKPKERSRIIIPGKNKQEILGVSKTFPMNFLYRKGNRALTEAGGVLFVMHFSEVEELTDEQVSFYEAHAKMEIHSEAPRFEDMPLQVIELPGPGGIVIRKLIMPIVTEIWDKEIEDALLRKVEDEERKKQEEKT